MDSIINKKYDKKMTNITPLRVDWLTSSAHFQYNNQAKEFLSFLHEKQRTMTAADSAFCYLYCDLLKLNMIFYSSGNKRGYKFILRSGEGYTCLLTAQYFESVPTMEMEFTGEFFLHKTLKDAQNVFSHFVNCLSDKNIFKFYTRRLDICADHISEHLPSNLAITRGSVGTSSSIPRVHDGVNDSLGSITLGSHSSKCSYMVCLYDKIDEQLQKKKKSYLESLEKGGFSVQNMREKNLTVYRVEFRFHKKVLRSKEISIFSIYDIDDRKLQDLWSFGINNARLINRDSKRISHCTTADFWLKLKEKTQKITVDFNTSSEKQHEVSALVKQAVGCLASALRKLIDTKIPVKALEFKKMHSVMLNLLYGFDKNYILKKIKNPFYRFGQVENRNFCSFLHDAFESLINFDISSSLRYVVEWENEMRHNRHDPLLSSSYYVPITESPF